MKLPWTEPVTDMFTPEDLANLQTAEPKQFSEDLYKLDMPLSAITNTAIAGIEELLAHGDYRRAQLFARHLLAQDYKLLLLYQETFKTPEHDAVKFLLTDDLVEE